MIPSVISEDVETQFKEKIPTPSKSHQVEKKKLTTPNSLDLNRDSTTAVASQLEPESSSRSSTFMQKLSSKNKLKGHKSKENKLTIKREDVLGPSETI